jgi:hypothetical protein
MLIQLTSVYQDQKIIINTDHVELIETSFKDDVEGASVSTRVHNCGHPIRVKETISEIWDKINEASK